MTTTIRRTIPFLVVAAICFFGMALVAHAQSCTAGSFCNPLNSTDSTVQGFIADFLKAVVEIALPFLTLFLVYSGFLFAFARGKPSELEKAKRNFLGVIIGALLILGCLELSNVLSGTVTQITNSSGLPND
jgi:hypothetical protein